MAKPWPEYPAPPDVMVTLPPPEELADVHDVDEAIRACEEVRHDNRDCPHLVADMDERIKQLQQRRPSDA